MTNSLNDQAYFLDMDAPATIEVVRDYARRSRAVAARTDTACGLSYGDAHAAQTYSVVWPAQREATELAVVFFHGGWWKAGNQQDRLFLAESLLGENVALVSVGYPLMPQSPLRVLADSAAQAVRRVAEDMRAELGRQLPLVISGNSAGAHLAAFAAGTLAGTEECARAHGIVGLSVASGLYDLEPLRHCFTNGWLALGEAEAEALSPIHRLPAPGLPVMVSVGELEPPGFHDQHELYTARLRAAGSLPQTHVAPGHDHFTLIGELGHAGRPLHDWFLLRRPAREA